MSALPEPAEHAEIHEAMRIAGERVDRDERIPVLNPYTDKPAGSVPRGTREDARRAFDVAAAYRPTLTRYERQQILLETSRALGARCRG